MTPVRPTQAPALEGTVKVTVAEWDSMFAINVRGVFLCLQAELKAMVNHGRGGSIINMGSILGHVAFAAGARYSAGHYIAAKHAVETAAQTLRDLRVGEVVKLDVTIDDGHVTHYRARVAISFKYEHGD